MKRAIFAGRPSLAFLLFAALVFALPALFAAAFAVPAQAGVPAASILQGACPGLTAPVPQYPSDGSEVLEDRDAGITEYSLGWSAVTGAIQYQVQVYEVATRQVVMDLETGATESPIEVNNEGAHRWRVRALSPETGCAEGPWSAIWDFVVVRHHALQAVSVRATDGAYTNRVVLTWSLESGESDRTPDGYEIYRGDALEGPRTKIGELRYPTILRYEDSSVAPGKRYVYWVRSVHEILWDNWSAPDEGWASAPCPTLIAPVLLEPPDGAVIAYDVSGWPGLTLDWSDVPGAGAYQYQIFDAASGELWKTETWDDSFALVFPVRGSYRWRVRALSAVAGCAPGPASGFRSFTLIREEPYRPVNVQASQGTFADRVVITWEIDRAQGTLEPEYFHIQRALTLTGTRTRIASRLDLSLRRYEDRTAEPGVHYFYWVQSGHDAIGPNSSDPAEGWRAAQGTLDRQVYLPLIER